MLPGEEGMKAPPGRCESEHRGDAGGVFFLVVAAPPPAARCFSKVKRGSLCPLTTSMSDPEQGRGGWINLAKQKNE